MAKIITNNINFTGRIGDYTFYQRQGKIVARSRRNEFDRRKLGIPQKRRSVSLSNCNNLWRPFAAAHTPYFTQGKEGSTVYSRFLSHAMQCSEVLSTAQADGEGNGNPLQ